MPEPLPLHDGGAFYHDRRTVGFHPALRGAAQLLVAGERRLPGLRESLHRTVDEALAATPPAAHPPATTPAPAARRIAAPLLVSGVRFHRERGFQPSGDAPAGSDEHRRLRARLRPANRVAAWARERYLASRWVVELLLLTAAARLELTARARARRDSGDAGEAARLRRAAAGWGPWVEALIRPPDEADVSLVLELAAAQRLPYLRPPEPPAAEDPADRLRLELPGWHPAMESWEEAEARMRRWMDLELQRYRRRVERRARRAGLKPAPVWTAGHHFDWLALRQLAGWTPARLVRRFGVASSTIHHGLQRTSELLELPLRPVPRGRGGV